MNGGELAFTEKNSNGLGAERGKREPVDVGNGGLDGSLALEECLEVPVHEVLERGQVLLLRWA